MKELEFLEQSKEIIDQIKSLSSDSAKIDHIVSYLSKANALLLEYTVVIDDLLPSQQMTNKILNVNVDSMSKLNDRIVAIEKHLEIHDTHIEAHDKHLDIIGRHLDSHNQYFDTHDTHLEILSQRLDLLEE